MKILSDEFRSELVITRIQNELTPVLRDYYNCNIYIGSLRPNQPNDKYWVFEDRQLQAHYVWSSFYELELQVLDTVLYNLMVKYLDNCEFELCGESFQEWYQQHANIR